MKNKTYQSIVTRISNKNDTLSFLKNEILSLTNKMIESDDKSRQSILAKRVSLLEEEQALLDEIQVLKDQRNIAFLIPFEDRLDNALTNSKNLQNQLKEKK